MAWPLPGCTSAGAVICAGTSWGGDGIGGGGGGRGGGGRGGAAMGRADGEEMRPVASGGGEELRRARGVAEGIGQVRQDRRHAGGVGPRRLGGRLRAAQLRGGNHLH